MGKPAKSTGKAPGKYYRKGLSLIELTRMFPNDAAAERFFVKARWPKGVCCPKCGSVAVQERPTRKPQPYRCRDCRKDFSVKTDTLMHNSPLGCQTWVIAIYLLTTNLKGVSSMRLHRDLGITQKSAWHLAHRIRENFQDCEMMAGPVEVDESYFGGKEKNKHASKKLKAGRGAVGKTAVLGAKDRATNNVSAEAVPFENVDKLMIREFVTWVAEKDATLYTDEAPVYNEFGNRETVCHSVGEFVKGMAHTNGLESFWALMKRGYYGTYHKLSPKHLNRYVQEFAGRHNIRGLDTIAQMALIARGLDRKRLRYSDLVADVPES